MRRYVNSFNVGDYVVCNHKYSWIRKGTTYQVKAVNRTGSIQLFGVSGNYDPDNFYLAPLRKVEHNPSIKNEKDPLCIAFIAHSGYELETLVKHYIDGKVSYTTDGEMIIARKSEIEQRLTSLYDSKDDVEEQWIIATIDSSITIETTKTFSVTKREIVNG